MRRLLQLHPDFVCPPLSAIEVEIDRPVRDALELRYLLLGTIDQLALPTRRDAERRDGLWQHSCFELFARSAPGSGYFEFNFAPSSAWAAYRFDNYRSGMGNAQLGTVPMIDVRSADTEFEMRVKLQLAGLGDLVLGTTWQLGISAVIEEADGNRSYWALAHPPGTADFHHPDCFALELAAAKPA